MATDSVRRCASNALHVHTSPSFGSLWLMPRLACFAKANPAVALFLSSSISHSDFTNDQVDIIRNKLRDAAIDGAVPVVGSIGTAIFGEHRDLGDPDIEYIQGGVAGDVKGEAKALGGLNLSLEGSDALE